MFPTELSTAINATIAGLVVGSVVKFIAKVLDQKQTELTTHVTLRKELREELDTVKLELRQIQLELDDWKQKYFDQVQSTNELKLAVINLNEELSEYKANTGIFQLPVPPDSN
jgi:chromosome segregation ATPase